jgi:hypothetical protein
MAPLIKKQDGNKKPSPIVFLAQGLIPDVRLKIFDTVKTHVYSIVLNFLSKFFLKFLDQSKVDGGKFAHKCMSKVDEDETWHLISEKENLNLPTRTASSVWFQSDCPSQLLNLILRWISPLRLVLPVVRLASK